MNKLRPTRSKSWCFFRVVVFWALGLFALPPLAWSSEATLRAAFVYNFIKFIQWPDVDSEADIHVCALGANEEIRNVLQEMNGKSVNKRVIKITYLNNQKQINSHLSKCQLVYRPILSEKLELPKELPPGVILVVDDPEKYDPNITITLCRNSEGRIEFGINKVAVGRSGVNISSQLLKLAKTPKYGGVSQ